MIFPTFQLYIEVCQLGKEKCSCSLNSITNIIQVGCSSYSKQIINLLDLDKDLNISNSGYLSIELIIRNKYFYSNLADESNRTFNYSINPNIDLINTLTLANNNLLDQRQQNNSVNMLILKNLNKLSITENGLVDIDSVWFKLNTNIKQLNLSANLLRLIKNDTFISL